MTLFRCLKEAHSLDNLLSGHTSSAILGCRMFLKSLFLFRGQSPLFIPPAFKPPGTSGPGGNLVGPGSSIFQPRDPDEFYPEIDPATGGGIPFM